MNVKKEDSLSGSDTIYDDNTDDDDDDDDDKEEIQVSGTLSTNKSDLFQAQYYPNNSVLQNLIETKDWDAVLGRLKNGGPHYVLPTCSGHPKVDEIGFFDDTLGMSPLHRALHCSQPITHQVWDSFAAQNDGEGQTKKEEEPEEVPPVSAEIINILLKEARQHATICNLALDEYPLNAACRIQRGSNKTEIVTKIFEEFPQAVWKSSLGRR